MTIKVTVHHFRKIGGCCRSHEKFGSKLHNVFWSREFLINKKLLENNGHELKWGKKNWNEEWSKL